MIPARLRCPCGTLVPPRQQARGSRASHLTTLICPSCGLRTAGDLPEHLTEAWNAAVERERQRMRDLGVNHR